MSGITRTTIYFDTEFTSLFSDAKLISIGLVEEHTGKSFYAECVDTYVVDQCSDFCRRSVLPLLEGGAASMKYADVQERLFAWLAQFAGDVKLVCDSPRDEVQVNGLFPLGLPAGCSVCVLGIRKNLVRRILNAGRRLHKANGLKVHHALDDAQVNRMIFSSKR